MTANNPRTQNTCKVIMTHFIHNSCEANMPLMREVELEFFWEEQNKKIISAEGRAGTHGGEHNSADAPAALVLEVHCRIYQNVFTWPQKPGRQHWRSRHTVVFQHVSDWPPEPPWRHWCSRCTTVHIKMYLFGHQSRPGGTVARGAPPYI